MLPMEWYEAARARMRELGLTQRDLMKPLGVKTRGAVGHYLTGRRTPSPSQIAELAKALRLSIDELMLPTQARPGTPATLDIGLLAGCIAGVRELLAGRQIPPDKESEIIARTYELLDGMPTKPDRATIVHFARRAAA